MGRVSAFLTGIVLEDPVHLPAKVLNRFPVQGINGFFPFSSAGDDSGFGQNLHIVGQGGLGNLEAFQQQTATHFPAGKQINDLDPLGIGEGFESLGDSGVLTVHIITSLSG